MKTIEYLYSYKWNIKLDNITTYYYKYILSY